MHAYGNTVQKLIIAAAVVAILGVHTVGSVGECFGQSDAGVVLLEATEVEDENGAQPEVLSAEDVERARVITTDRIYGLAGFWVVIILAIVLIRIQTRADNRLYREGYYERDLH